MTRAGSLFASSLALALALVGCSRAERSASSAAPMQPPQPGAAQQAPTAETKKPEEPMAPAPTPTAQAHPKSGGGGSASDLGKISAGAAQVSGSLAPEVIHRVVRQSFGPMQACYDKGLHADPTLQGRVSIKLVIGKTGATKSANVANTDLADKSVASCVAGVFARLSFPPPERDEVTVVYPVAFSPGETPSP